MEAMRSLAPGDPLGKAVLRTILIVVAVVITLYVIYLLRKPIIWLVIAAFIAVAMSGPVNLFSRVMKRGLAVALSYLILIMIPIGLGALLIPTIVEQGETLANNVPEYAADVTQFVNDNKTLRDLNDRYDFTSEIESAAKELPSRLGDAAGILSDIGVGVVNSIFAVVTILILSVFMVGGGPRWVHAFVSSQPESRRERVERTLEHIAHAIGNYVGGVLLQATIAATFAFIVLTILGVPFAGPLALLYFFFELIPVVGATIAAVLIAIVVLFATDFPIGLIIWVIFAIVYQQVENYVIQPQIQRRAAKLEPFVILVAVLFGATLFGIVGAILAIPTAASIQIAVREYIHYRRETEDVGPPESEAPTASQPAG
ncbi:MAG TPA: AI-2E family transporter [Solirubrobacterales bacterium]|nr:AI-2E family transporter [Solirubrobacterales bacterium]